MNVKSLKLLGSALVCAGGLLLLPAGTASAGTLPNLSNPAKANSGIAGGLVKKAHRRRYRHYHGRRFRYRRPGYGYYYGGWWYPAPWWSGPVVVVPRARRHRGNRHVRWCLRRYRTYNPRTDQYKGYDGYYHYCRSPFR